MRTRPRFGRNSMEYPYFCLLMIWGYHSKFTRGIEVTVETTFNFQSGQHKEWLGPENISKWWAEIANCSTIFQCTDNYCGDNFYLQWKACYTIDIINDTRHLCTRLGIDGVNVMSRGFSRGKQLIKFANTSNRGRVCLFSQNELTISVIKWTVRLYRQVLRHNCLMWTSTFASIYKKSNTDHFNP